MTTEQNYMTTAQKKDEKKERQRLEALWWAGSLIWAGVVFGADGLGFLPQIGQADAWSWIFFGAGLYGTQGNLYRASSADYPNPTTWDYLWAGFLLLVSLGGVIGIDIFWPSVLALVGVAILGDVLRSR